MKRKIAAVMAADIVGYGQLVAEDAEETQRRLESYRAVFEDFVSRSSGRIVRAPGNAVLAEFSSAVEAVRCAIDVQESLRTRNLAYPPSRQMRFRIGITIGDVVEQGIDLLGDGVNVAVRLQGLAQPGGLCVSRAVYEQVVNKLSVEFIDIGEQEVQNLPTPVRAYSLTLGAARALMPAPARRSVGKRTMGIWPVSIAAALVAAFATGAVLYFITPQSGPAPEAIPAPSAVPAAPPSPPAQRRAEELVPERVPFITDRQRTAIRNEYLPGPDHKALAISFLAEAFITDQADDDTAKAAALDACQKITDNINKFVRCEVYAVGTSVVSARGRPPMPPVPWLIRDSSIETPFVAKNVPFLDGNVRTVIEKFYQPARKPKALAVSAQGQQGFYINQTSADEAVRRGLETCGSRVHDRRGRRCLHRSDADDHEGGRIFPPRQQRLDCSRGARGGRAAPRQRAGRLECGRGWRRRPTRTGAQSRKRAGRDRRRLGGVREARSSLPRHCHRPVCGRAEISAARFAPKARCD
jgi:adenylate cyclase